jgi:hypothetical protein
MDCGQEKYPLKNQGWFSWSKRRFGGTNAIYRQRPSSSASPQLDIRHARIMDGASFVSNEIAEAEGCSRLIIVCIDHMLAIWERVPWNKCCANRLDSLPAQLPLYSAIFVPFPNSSVSAHSAS